MSVKRNPEAERAPEFTYTTAEWMGPNEYVIIYAEGDKKANRLARMVQAFFKKYEGWVLPVLEDTVAETSKEILVGDTNRRNTALDFNQFATAVEGERLIFEGGHIMMVEKAVKWFMSRKHDFGTAIVLSGTAEDFVPTVTIDGQEYNYVWGDEFDGNFLDPTKFGFNYHMPNRSHEIISLHDERVARVENGVFKMTSGYTEPSDNVEHKYKMSGSVCTGDTMWYKFGYLEMRARIPMKHGCWPGWWALTYCNSKAGKMQGTDYLVEVDMFEVFSHWHNEFLPNIHKWYKNYAGTFTELYDEKGDEYRHSSVDVNGWHVDRYTLEDSEENQYVYRTFGFKWNENEMTLSVDGEDYMTFDLNRNLDDISSMHHFKDTPTHIIFTNWIHRDGGWMSWEGNWATDDDLPAEYVVDYIRLYQKDGEGTLEDLGLDMDIKL